VSGVIVMSVMTLYSVNRAWAATVITSIDCGGPQGVSVPRSVEEEMYSCWLDGAA
jgi:hypothetical protein